MVNEFIYEPVETVHNPSVTLYSLLFLFILRAAETPDQQADQPSAEQENTFIDRELSPHQLTKEEHKLRQFRQCLRVTLDDVRKQIKYFSFPWAHPARYRPFLTPVNKADVPDYYDIIKNPMCIEDMYDKIDRDEYKNIGMHRSFLLFLEMFMNDVKLIESNARQYNPSVDTGKRIIHCARALKEEIESSIFEFQETDKSHLFDIVAVINERRESMFCSPGCVNLLEEEQAKKKREEEQNNANNNPTTEDKPQSEPEPEPDIVTLIHQDIEQHQSSIQTNYVFKQLTEANRAQLKKEALSIVTILVFSTYSQSHQ